MNPFLNVLLTVLGAVGVLAAVYLFNGARKRWAWLDAFWQSLPPRFAQGLFIGLVAGAGYLVNLAGGTVSPGVASFLPTALDSALLALLGSEGYHVARHHSPGDS